MLNCTHFLSAECSSIRSFSSQEDLFDSKNYGGVELNQDHHHEVEGEKTRCGDIDESQLNDITDISHNEPIHVDDQNDGDNKNEGAQQIGNNMLEITITAPQDKPVDYSIDPGVDELHPSLQNVEPLPESELVEEKVEEVSHINLTPDTVINEVNAMKVSNPDEPKGACSIVSCFLPNQAIVSLSIVV